MSTLITLEKFNSCSPVDYYLDEQGMKMKIIRFVRSRWKAFEFH